MDQQTILTQTDGPSAQVNGQAPGCDNEPSAHASDGLSGHANGPAAGSSAVGGNGIPVRAGEALGSPGEQAPTSPVDEARRHLAGDVPVVGMDVRPAAGELRDALACLGRVDVHGMSIPELKQLSGLAGRVKTTAESLLVRIAAQVQASGTNASPQKVLQDATKMSKHDARRMGRVAEALEALPNVAERFGTGKLTFDHAAALVDTARQTGAAAVDANTALLDRAGEAPADLFATEARSFADQHAADRGEQRLKNQRRRRRASLFLDEETGMGRVSGWFDPLSFGLLRQAVEGHADLLRRDDNTHRANGADPGGAGIFAGIDDTGRRSLQQLRADAFFELATQRHALTHQPLTDDPDGGGTGDAKGKSRQTSPPASRAGKAGRKAARADTQLVIVADIGLLDGENPEGRCEIPGTGPVPPSILKRLSPDAKLAGIIFAGNGRTLWLGRNRRYANAAQHLALTARDRGCVQCAAPMHQTDTHHITPWEQGGPTDIDNLQAICTEHHRHHHGPNQYRSSKNTAAQNATNPAPGARRADTGDGRADPSSRRPDKRPPNRSNTPKRPGNSPRRNNGRAGPNDSSDDPP